MELKSYLATIFVVVFQLLTSLETASSSVITRQEQEAYLKRFAYMGTSSRDPRLGELTNPEDKFRLAVQKFQMMAGINITGTVDSETRTMMDMPRCGVPDEAGMGMRRRKRRYAAEGSKWPRTFLTYRINNFTPDLPMERTRLDMKAALQQWSDVSPLRFREVTSTSQKVDIDIQFARGDHGDGSPFDGPGLTLAHAFFPQYGGGTHFDEDETWTYQSSSGTNLLQVAIHEFGHALGLGHSDEKASIMAPFYRGYTPNVKLHSDDIEGITYIYGRNPVMYTSTSTRPTRPSIVPVTRGSTRAPPPKSLCKDPRVDAFFEALGYYYLFKGNQYYKLGSRGILPDYPRLIIRDWPGLPDNIDTAFYCSGFIYFFKDDKVWQFFVPTRQLQSSYPQKISTRFFGIPSNLDAAFIWSGNRKLYFIKGDKYYRVSNFIVPQHSRVDPGYPSKLSYWPGLPEKIDAAFNLGNSRTYFFSGENYYRFNDVRFKVDDGYPIPTSRVWLHCPVNLVESPTSMVDDEWAHGKDQFISSSGPHLASLRLPISSSATLLTLILLFSL